MAVTRTSPGGDLLGWSTPHSYLYVCPDSTGTCSKRSAQGLGHESPTTLDDVEDCLPQSIALIGSTVEPITVQAEDQCMALPPHPLLQRRKSEIFCTATSSRIKNQKKHEMVWFSPHYILLDSCLSGQYSLAHSHKFLEESFICRYPIFTSSSIPFSSYATK